MGRIFKILFGVFSIIVALIVLAVIILPFVITPNDFKPEIQSVVQSQIGRKLTIEGDLELSVFPWIGVSTGRLILSNPEKFATQPFAEIASSHIKVKLLPLLSRQVEVSKVVLKGLSLHLIKNKQGQTNWDDLTATDKQANQTPQPTTDNPTSALAAWAIGGIVVEQAHIIWDDQQQAQTIEIKDFNFNTGTLAFDRQIDLDLSFSLSTTEPAITETIQLSTGVTVNPALNQIKLDQLTINSLTRGKTIPGNHLELRLQTNVAVDLAQQTVTLAELMVKSNNLVLNGQLNAQHILQQPRFNGTININPFNLAELMQTMNIKRPPMQAADALDKFALNFALSGDNDSVAIKNLNITLDKSQMKGMVVINHFSKPAIQFNLNLDTLDIDRYLAAPVKPSVNNVPLTPASAVASSAGLLPIKTLRHLDAQGQLTINQLKVKQLTMQGIKLELKAQSGIINLQQVINQLYQGHYQGTTSINVKSRKPVIALTEKITQVAIQPLLNDLMGQAKITGTFNASAQLKTTGNTQRAMKAGLHGKLAFNFKDGVVKGFNLQRIIDHSRLLIEGRPLPVASKNDQTVFSVIKGTAQIQRGLISNRDLYAEASKLRVSGQGTAHLVSEQLDYRVEAKLLKQLATTNQPEKIKGVPVIINIGGDFKNPSYQLDLAQMLLEKNRTKINQKAEKLLNKLDKKLGPGVGNLIKGFF